MKKKENLAGYLFILPSLLGVTIFLLYPVIFSFALSFCKWNLVSGIKGIEFVGLQNFFNLTNDDWFINSLKNNILYTVIVVSLTLGISLILSVLLNNMVLYGKQIRLAFFVPYISNIVATTVIWMVLFEAKNGPVNSILRSLGVNEPPKWLVSSEYALLNIMMFSIWSGIGYCLIVYISALNRIPRELYESSQIDGANEINKFFHITLPMLSPTTFFLLITRIITSFQVFAPVKIMTQGGPGSSTTVIVYQIYREAFRFYKMGYASSIAWVLFIIIFIFTMVQWRLQDRWVTY